MLCQCAEKRSLAFDTHPPPIGLHGKDFLSKLALSHTLELVKLLKHIRFATQEVNSCKFAEVIYKAYIVIVSTYRCRCWTPHIGKMSSRGLDDTLVDLG
jgi:hypothetical protein